MKALKSLAILCLGLMPGAAFAVPLAPGQSVFPLASTSLAERPDLGGAIVEDTILGPYDLEPDPFFLAGHNVQSRIIDQDNGNLAFYTRLREFWNTTFSDLYIDSVTLTGYAGFDVDAIYRSDGDGDVGPTGVSRSADGDSLTFDFDFPIFVGNLVQEVQQESLFFGAVTNGEAYANTGQITVTGRLPEIYPDQVLSVTLGGLWVPVMLPDDTPQVPLPASALLLLTGLGAVSLTRRRKA